MTTTTTTPTTTTTTKKSNINDDNNNSSSCNNSNNNYNNNNINKGSDDILQKPSENAGLLVTPFGGHWGFVFVLFCFFAFYIFKRSWGILYMCLECQ